MFKRKLTKYDDIKSQYKNTIQKDISMGTTKSRVLKSHNNENTCKGWSAMYSADLQTFLINSM